jgi:hypothetical protein
MKTLRGRLRDTLRKCALLGLLWSGLIAPVFADGVITVEPALVEPDENGVARFSIAVAGVPEPGFRSYALSVRFDGEAINLVDSINTLALPTPTDHISCAAMLRLDAVSETVLPGVGIILESGQGAFVLDSVGEGILLATDNRIVDANTAQYNVGVTGVTGVVTPQIGDGNLIDYRCLVGEAVPAGTSVTITPDLYPGLEGAIFLDEPGSLPVISTFSAGYIQLAAINDPPVLDPIGDKIVIAGETLTFYVTASDPNGDSLSLYANDLPEDASFIDFGDGTGLFTWTPEFDDDGIYLIIFTVFDDGGPPLPDSEAISITVKPGIGEVPTAPENLKVRITGPRVVLTWNDSDTATEFHIYRQQSTDNDFRKIGETEEYIYYDRLKRCVTSADYYVVAVNEFGESDPSRIVTATVKNLPPNCD